MTFLNAQFDSAYKIAYEQSFKKAFKRGEIKRAKSIAIKLIRAGKESDEYISDLLGLTTKEVAELRKTQG